MKIQLALDRLTKEECFQLIDKTVNYTDIVEIGTGVIKEYGMDIIRETHAKYPQLSLLADMKTCDAGKSEAIQAFSSGTDIMTVMAFSDNQTIIETLLIAKKYKKQVMIDLLGIESKKRVEELASLGCNLFCLHIGKDKQKQGKPNFEELFYLTERIQGIDLAVAGGIDATSIQDLKKHLINIVIIGSAVTLNQNPKLAIQEIRDSIL